MMVSAIAKRTGLSLLAFMLIFVAYTSFVPIRSTHAASAATPSNILIDGTAKFQTIDGFGFSEAFGRAASIFNAPPDVRTQILNLLFNPTTGAGFSILRNIINSDSTSIEPNSPGSPLAPPQYVWDGSDSSQVWLAQQAQLLGVHQFFADAWSAPGYMKTNGDQANGGTLCGAPNAAPCSTGDWRQAYANYLMQYIEDYQSVGIKLTNIDFVNESNIGPTYSSMIMDPTQNADFAKVLGLTLHDAHINTHITCCDAEGWDLAPAYTAAITSDPIANQYVKVISSHGYTAPPASPLATNGQHVWQTEWANFDPFDPAWDDGTAAAGFTWAQRIYTALAFGNVSAFFHWWGLNTSFTNSGVIHLDTTTNTVQAASRLWAFANYSRFIRPGAIRIGTTTVDTNLQTTAFRNTNGTIAVVILNNAPNDITTTINLHRVKGTSAVPYLTNNSNGTAQQPTIAIQNGTFTATVPARSLVTYQIS